MTKLERNQTRFALDMLKVKVLMAQAKIIIHVKPSTKLSVKARQTLEEVNTKLEEAYDTIEALEKKLKIRTKTKKERKREQEDFL